LDNDNDGGLGIPTGEGGDLIVERNLAQEFLLKFPICLQKNFFVLTAID